MENWEKHFSKKKDSELDEMIADYKDSYSDFLEALKEELKKRDYQTEQIDEIDKEIQQRKKIKTIVDNQKIKTSYSFKWTPKYSTNFSTKLPPKIALNSMARAILALDWIVVHADDNSIEAKRPNRWGEPTEKITVTVKNEHLTVQSKSLKNNVCDFGWNSRRVAEFEMAYKQIELGYNESEIAKELAEIKQKEEDSKYVIPDQLTKAPRYREKNISYLLGSALVLSLGLGALLALCAQAIYIIFLYDFLIGLMTAYTLGYFMKLSNITDFKILRWVGFASIALTYFLSQVYRFQYILSVNNVEGASIIDYFRAKLEHGLPYKDANFGAIGLIIAWGIELVVAGAYYQFHIAQKSIKYDLENAPEDVVDFAMYWFNEDKDEDGVRKELSKKGWSEKAQQDLIIKAVSARCSIHEIQRD